MSDIEVTSRSEDGYAVTGVVGDWELTTDATGETGPTPNQVLAADYAACFVPAFRVAADRLGHDDVGVVEVDVGVDLDEDDDLESVSFEIEVEATLGDDAEEVVDRAEDICHVHSALREELHAAIAVRDGQDL
jgi:Predicted redox protein, regulator of disulfide bond formation